MKQLKGAGVALVTPFLANGAVDYAGLERLITFQLEGGTDYLVSLGTTGETATLNMEERKKIWAFTVKCVEGRVPLVAGIGGNHTAEIVQTLKETDLSGFSAILSVSPYYNKPTQEGIFLHYDALAKASPLPLILYNVPGRTGSNMTAETTLRLAHAHPSIVAIKEASGNFDQMSKIMRDKPSDFLLISGDDLATLPMMALGAVGLISVVGNAYPSEIKNLVQACTENRFNEARELHSSLITITELCFAEGNPGGIKEFLAAKGICETTMRLPLAPVSQSTATAIQSIATT
jgi:4-hydroxy-tetrahydrodipicolinate synthase